MIRNGVNAATNADSFELPKQIVTIKRIVEFEGLRGLLAWWIVLGHFLQRSGYHAVSTLPPLTGWMIQGRYAVDVFIILSGFVITLVLDTQSHKTYLQFLIERFFRLFPVYIVSFFVAILLQPLNIFIFTYGKWHAPEFAAKVLRQAQQSYDYLIPHLIAHVSLLHGAIPNQVLPSSNIAFLTPAWAVSLEWQFYLIAPALIWVIRRSLSMAILAFAFLLLSKRLFVDWSFGNQSFLPLKFEFFTIGIVSYYLYRLAKDKPQWMTQNFAILASVAIVGSVSLRFAGHGLFTKWMPMTIWSIVLSAVIAFTLQITQQPYLKVSQFLGHPLLQELGKISYSTYLIHFPVMWFVIWIALKVNPGIGGNSVLLLLITFGSAITLCASFVLFEWIEKPLGQLGKQLVKQQKLKTQR